MRFELHVDLSEVTGYFNRRMRELGEGKAQAQKSQGSEK